MGLFSRKTFHKVPLMRAQNHSFCGDGMRLEDKTRHKRRNRSKIQIAADILEIAKNGSRKTRIMYLGNLSFDLLQKYLDSLVKTGLIEIDERDEKTFKATEKGRRFLEDFRELQKYSEISETKKQELERSLTQS